MKNNQKTRDVNPRVKKSLPQKYIIWPKYMEK